MGDVTAALDSSSSSFKTPICDKPLILTIEGKGSGQALKLSFEGLEISMTLLKQSAPSFQKLSISDASEKVTCSVPQVFSKIEDQAIKFGNFPSQF
ncbi:uncharacterized protein LOC131159537 isoform X4 [Malania oleifera]|uniref:uncharacterized protein LOC131159537 isoform X4 n=1 Tax=Malania oleifera TaxID=397392 RepID=UPI0025ADB521|nr:uncharacterized protein LOC131159537 isoform X4 [Malania oleifera]XP_057970529.1 uncharacterized protein LOC131159537 isoform X4 [Malania oleifera]